MKRNDMLYTHLNICRLKKALPSNFKEKGNPKFRRLVAILVLLKKEYFCNTFIFHLFTFNI
ncbi:hypothetical protein BpHYR1_052122 [Brachionus plicatilis]|uniref:Uncharacterized protein n=1 Tax=Brachionus plicatilis TaxID=10195 RepID=A0A3M7RX94_BRAPC|nr:hypothetical protein BpHYR1_052122 [Brachionus plicatilis]